MKQQIVLAVDPGLLCAGYSLLALKEHKVFLLDCGFLKQSSSHTVAKRVHTFYTFFADKIAAYHVTDVALETPFLGKNAQNFLKLGYLRGALYVLSEQHGLQLHEYGPREVKQSVTGYGAADKEQVARVILQLFPGMVTPDKKDVTDAVAVGLCCVWRGNSPFIKVW
jgi:crossover junction endodeoxyribonuclease RuvC